MVFKHYFIKNFKNYFIKSFKIINLQQTFKLKKTFKQLLIINIIFIRLDYINFQLHAYFNYNINYNYLHIKESGDFNLMETDFSMD